MSSEKPQKAHDLQSAVYDPFRRLGEFEPYHDTILDPSTGNKELIRRREEAEGTSKLEDNLGDFGSKPWTAGQKISLVLRGILLFPIKFSIAFTALVGAWLASWICSFFPEDIRQAVYPPILKFFVRGCLLGLGFVSIEQEKMKDSRYEDERPVVVIANHNSYIDILLMIWLYAPTFVARKGTDNLLFVGRIASAELNCIFVDREKSKGGGVSDLVKERILQNVDRRAALQPYNPVLLFPEGTTTNGRYLLEFRTGAFLAGAPVKPIILTYGESSCGFSPTWETLSAVTHIFHACAAPFHRVKVLELPTYHPSDEERKDPQLYASNVRQLFLRTRTDLVPSSSTLVDKLVYHRTLRDLAKTQRQNKKAGFSSDHLPLIQRSSPTDSSVSTSSEDGGVNGASLLRVNVVADPLKTTTAREESFGKPAKTADGPAHPGHVQLIVQG